ncbi:MAG: hypothetical protein ABFD18_17480 [Syntrophomonas sp.]
MGDTDKDFEIILFTYQESDKTINNIMESKKSGDLGGSISRNIYAIALDTANSGLLGPKAQGAAQLVNAITGKAKEGGDNITQDLQKLNEIIALIIALNNEVQTQLSEINDKLDDIKDLIQWTYALGNTQKYASFLEEATKLWKNLAKSENKDGSLNQEQLDFAKKILDINDGSFTFQLKHFYEGLTGNDITEKNEELGLFTQFLKQTWEKTAASNLQTWYQNAAIFISRVKSILISGIHVVIWAAQATNSTELDYYQKTFGVWLQTIDNQLKQLIPDIMNQLFIKDTSYNFRIKPITSEIGVFKLKNATAATTDPFNKDGHVLQRLVLIETQFIKDDSCPAIWQPPPALKETKPPISLGIINNVEKGTQYNVHWNIDQFTINIVKADIGKLSSDEPIMSVGSIQTTYIIQYPKHKTFNQEDAVLTTNGGISLVLAAQSDWKNRNVWQLRKAENDSFLATSYLHGYTFDDQSWQIPRFTSEFNEYLWSTSWFFEKVQSNS